MWLLLISAAFAAPVGPPVATPEDGSVSLRLRGDGSQTAEEDADCPRGGNCDAVWRAGRGALAVDVDILRGVGVFGEVGWANTKVQEANFKGDGVAFAAGGRAALPLGESRWWIGGVGRYEQSRPKGGAVQAGGTATSAWQLVTASALASWDDGEVAAWGGAQTSLWWYHHVQPLGSDERGPLLDLTLNPKLPVTGVLGGLIRSGSLGPAWERGGRAEIGIEGRFGQERAFSTWVGVGF